MNKRETFSFPRLPTSVTELQALPEAAMQTPFQTAALTAAALCAWGDNPQAVIDMLNYLKGPQPLSAYETQFLRDRLQGKLYKPFSFFSGASPANNYTPAQPYRVTVMETPYSNAQAGEGYVQLYLQSGGADTPRPVKLRQKPSTGQWFLWEQMLLSDIREPVAADPWA